MNLVLAAGLVVAAVAIAVTTMLLVRHRAPAGGYFSDGDRAAGVFGVLATGFAVLLGFIVFLAFESYDSARSGAETEALLVAQQVETAQLMPPDVRAELTSELVCYARSVAGVQWRRMESGTLGESLNPWATELFRTIRTVEPGTAVEQSAYDRWMDQTSEREAARNDRIHGGAGVIPAPLWVVLFLCAAIIFVYVLFFADSTERALVQAMLMGSVIAVMSLLLVLLVFLDNPFHPGFGGLKPTAMTRTLTVVDEEVEVAGLQLDLPCDDDGRAR